ncbi:MAG: SagB/ThcOx family dehydrogenase [Candidatus Eisenbacteria bacterium]|nr:SagB/ThcOx family dehydrogenase [Candidatus Eisenbacteria bacterium]
MSTCRYRRSGWMWLPGIAAMLLALLGPLARGEAMASDRPSPGEVMALPAPERTGEAPFESLLQQRTSLREYAPEPLSLVQIGQLLWATNGTTQRTYFTHRTIPSAGALYPLEIYVLTARGVAHYDPFEHRLRWHRAEDARAALAAAALQQSWVREAPAVFVIAAEPARTTVKYGPRGERYVDIECGLACQNLLLQATALGLGGVPVGAFEDQAVAEVVGLPAGQVPRLLVPIGRPR